MSKPRLHLLPILFVAATLRLLIVWWTATTHTAQWFFGQASELACLAESLRSGHGLSSPFGGHTGPSAFLSPGYPALVAAVFAVFQPYSHASAVALMIVQTGFAVGTVAALMLLAQRLFGATAANVAGAAWAIAPPVLFLPTVFWETSLSILLLTSALGLGVSVAQSPTRWRWTLYGVLTALAIAVNPSLLLAFLGIGVWAAWQARNRTCLSPILGLVVFLLLSTLWVVRNERMLHAFIPLRDNVGYELWQGNRIGSDGLFLGDLHPNTSAAEFRRFEQLGELGYMHEKSEIAKRDIASDLVRVIRLTGKRFVYFWTGRGRAPAPLIVFYLTTTTLLGLTGLWVFARASRSRALLLAIPLLAFPMPYYLTHPDFRFRLVLDPILVALTAYLLVSRFASSAEPTLRLRTFRGLVEDSPAASRGPDRLRGALRPCGLVCWSRRCTCRRPVRGSPSL